MEYRKKKNESRAEDQKRFIVIATLLILVLLFGLGLLVYMIVVPRDDMGFNQTATNLLATNPAVITLLVETEIAATEQFIMTSTVRP